MKQYYIYKIICLCDEWNGKFYIGKRYGKLDDNYTGSGKLIREYFKEYGKEKDITYEKIILEIGDENSICDLEREYIREGMKSQMCLNLQCQSSKGTFGYKGLQFSDEHRKKISESLKRRVSPNKGKHLSDEQRRKISEGQKGRVSPNKGKQFSAEHKMKLSEAAKRRWARN